MFDKPATSRLLHYEKVVVAIVVEVCPEEGFGFVFNDPRKGNHFEPLALQISPGADGSTGASEGQVGPSIVVPIGQRDGSAEMAVPVVLGNAVGVRAVEKDLRMKGTCPRSQDHHQHAQKNSMPPHEVNLRIQFDSQVFLGQRFMDGSELVVRA